MNQYQQYQQQTAALAQSGYNQNSYQQYGQNYNQYTQQYQQNMQAYQNQAQVSVGIGTNLSFEGVIF